MSGRAAASGRGNKGCFDKAVELLARRPHLRRQLEVKLERRGFGATTIAKTCDRLEQLGYLDDLAVARQLASGEMLRKGYGPRRLRAELARRGACDEVVDRVVAEARSKGELELARTVAAKWLSRHSWDKPRLARHLERRGFTVATVVTVLEESGQAAEDGRRSESD